jgi:uncharacterized membrane protein
MTLYHLATTLHILATMLWLGHMFVWSALTGPALKRISPAETAEMLRERSVYLGALGWPALAILIPTGLYQLSVRGIGLGDLVSLSFLSLPHGGAIGVKILLVAWMVVYQAIFGHHRAPFVVWVNIAAACVVLAISVVLVRGWT